MQKKENFVQNQLEIFKSILKYRKNFDFLKLVVNWDYFFKKTNKQEGIEFYLYKSKEKTNIKSSNDLSKLTRRIFDLCFIGQIPICTQMSLEAFYFAAFKFGKAFKRSINLLDFFLVGIFILKNIKNGGKNVVLQCLLKYLS